MAAYNPQCAALTAEGKQCRNSARGSSKYCASHKGYQPPATRGLAQRIEGDSWSSKDNLTDRQSRRNADTVPAVGKARDTPLAVRSKSKKAAKPSKAAASKPRKAAAAKPATKVAKAPARKSAPSRPAARRATPRTAQGDRQDAGYVATLLQEERDYLVVYEEPDPDGMPTDDGLLLDIDAGQPVSLGEVNLEQKLDLELNNNATWVGKLGFGLAVLGALFGVATCVWFAMIYPQEWYLDSGAVSGSWKVPGTALFAVASFLLMLAGVVLTHYGRRIQAKGNLSRMRIVEKAFQPRVALGEDA